MWKKAAVFSCVVQGVTILATVDCGSGGVCPSNATHTATPHCVCPTFNDDRRAYNDPNNVCCYDPLGACNSPTNFNFSGDPPVAVVERCFNKNAGAEGCTNAYPVLGCQPFYVHAMYTNLAKTNWRPLLGQGAPMLGIAAVGSFPYQFTYEDHEVPWGNIDSMATAHSDTLIEAINSRGRNAQGLDPGAAQCVYQNTFLIALRGVRSANPQVSLEMQTIADS